MTNTMLLIAHIRKMLTAPSGEGICACKNVNAVKAGAETPCWYCEARTIVQKVEAGD